MTSFESNAVEDRALFFRQRADDLLDHFYEKQRLLQLVYLFS